MKSLWILFVLSGALAIGASCGPQQAFCPNTGNNGVCPIVGDDAAPIQGTGGSTGPACPTGQQLMTNPDGNAGLICVPSS